MNFVAVARTAARRSGDMAPIRVEGRALKTRQPARMAAYRLPPALHAYHGMNVCALSNISLCLACLHQQSVSILSL